MNKNTDTFLDKNTLWALVLVLGCWLAWDYYMRSKYPPPKKQNSFAPVFETSKAPEEQPLSPPPPAFRKKEQVFSYQNQVLAFDLSSQGMGFKSLTLKKVLDRKGRAIKLLSGEAQNLAFETRFFNRLGSPPQKLHFDIKALSPVHWEGISHFQGMKIKKTLKMVPEKPSFFDMHLNIQGNAKLHSGISTLFHQKYGFEKEEKPSFFSSLFQAPDILSFFISSYQIKSRYIDVLATSPENLYREAQKTPVPEVKALALGTRYVGQAWINQSETTPQFQFLASSAGGGRLQWSGRLDHLILNLHREFEASYRIFIGPKSLPLFQKSAPELMEWVNFGWFSSLARWILKILRVFYQITGNWGVAIICLTLLVRLLLLPLVISSYRSMEAMKKIQPQLTEIRTRFKKDPQRMNQEIMALMKASRANPIGGCLPMFLQIPVFWALWKALSNSYSLYRSPFVFWIQDLSFKDPYYTLPVLIGVLMWVQQKISPPAGINPEINRVLQILPVFVSLCMINFPSGLTLYVLVSSAFGLLQQVYLNTSQQKPLGKS